MVKPKEIAEKKPTTWIQFQVSDLEYHEIQRIKAVSGKSKISNKDFYHELFLKGMESEQSLLCP